jgi:hypothetical protein
MFIDLRTDNDAINWIHLQLTRHAYHSNPLNCVTARLQRNEDEASSDDESFVSITEVPFADPSMSEIHKVHKPDSDALEPRVTGFKSRSLNIKGGESKARWWMPRRQTPSPTQNHVPMLRAG